MARLTIAKHATFREQIQVTDDDGNALTIASYQDVKVRIRNRPATRERPLVDFIGVEYIDCANTPVTGQPDRLEIVIPHTTTAALKSTADYPVDRWPVLGVEMTEIATGDVFASSVPVSIEIRETYAHD